MNSRLLFFEAIETGIAAIRTQVIRGAAYPHGKRPPRPRKGFAPHLERVEVVIERDELPEHAGKQKVAQELCRIEEPSTQVSRTLVPMIRFGRPRRLPQTPRPHRISAGSVAM